MSARSRAVGEGPSVFLDMISGGDQEEVTLRVSGGFVGVVAKEEEDWRQENRVRGRGGSNAMVTTDRLKVSSNNL